METAAAVLRITSMVPAASLGYPMAPHAQISPTIGLFAGKRTATLRAWMARLCAETEMLTNQLPKNANAMTERHLVPSAPIASSPVTRIARQTSSAVLLHAAAPMASIQATKQRAQTMHLQGFLLVQADQGSAREASASCLAISRLQIGTSTSLALRHQVALLARLTFPVAQQNASLDYGQTRAGTFQI